MGAEAPGEWRMKWRRVVGALALGLALAGAGTSPGQKDGPGEVNTPPARGERVKDRVKAGDAAPDFTLAEVTGDKKVTLSSFKGQRPVVLVFGSYT